MPFFLFTRGTDILRLFAGAITTGAFDRTAKLLAHGRKVRASGPGVVCRPGERVFLTVRVRQGRSSATGVWRKHGCNNNPPQGHVVLTAIGGKRLHPTVLCKEGQRGREFFVIIEGEAEVTRGGKHLATIGRGEFFGEIALLERVVRTATVTAATPLRFFVVSDSSFSSMLATDPKIERQLLRALARRLVSMTGDPST